MRILMNKIHWVSDPGHAWLKVSIREILSLDIQSQISEYSYYHGDYAYLEEDCDANVYFTAIMGEEWHKNPMNFLKVSSIPHKHTDTDAKCRSYRPFTEITWLKVEG